MKVKITEERIKEYTKTLNKVLESRDLDRLRKFIQKNWDIYSDYFKSVYELKINDDEWLYGTMAKMIVNTRTNKISLEARQWAWKKLNELGWNDDIKINERKTYDA